MKLSLVSIPGERKEKLSCVCMLLTEHVTKMKPSCRVAGKLLPDSSLQYPLIYLKIEDRLTWQWKAEVMATHRPA